MHRPSEGLRRQGRRADRNQREPGRAEGRWRDVSNLRDHVEKAGVTYVTVDAGNKVTDVLGGQSTPHCFVIDRDGVLRFSGALDNDPRGTKGGSAVSYVRDALERCSRASPWRRRRPSPMVEASRDSLS